MAAEKMDTSGSCCGRSGGVLERERADSEVLGKGGWKQAFGTSRSRLLQGKAFLGFRLIMALILTAIEAHSWQNSHERGVLDCYGAYLTHWANMLATVQCWCALWAAWSAQKAAAAESGGEQQPMPLYASLAWVLRDLVLPCLSFVVIMFYVLVVPTLKGPVGFHSINTHGVNYFFILVDAYLSRLPFQLRHFWIFAFTGCLYVGFLGVYYGAGGTDCAGSRNVYQAVDFSKPASTGILLTLCVVVVLPVLHLTCWFAFKKCCCTGPQRFSFEEDKPENEATANP